MLYAIIGSKGEGKSLTAVKFMLEKYQHCFYGGFVLKNKELLKKCTKLRLSDFIMQKEVTNISGKTRIVNTINWAYWENVRNKYKSYCIVIDEMHNLAHHRRSMSEGNVLWSKFSSQVRKVLADSDTSDMIIISQEFRKIDIDVAMMCDYVIKCTSYKLKDKHFIKLRYFTLDSHSDELEYMGVREVFRAEPYYKLYDRNAISYMDGEDEI